MAILEMTKQEIIDNATTAIKNFLDNFQDDAPIRIKGSNAIMQDVFPGSEIIQWRFTFDLAIEVEPEQKERAEKQQN